MEKTSELIFENPKIITEEMLDIAQKECLNTLYNGIMEGDGKRFSVVGRVGHGKKTISYILAQKLEGKKVAFISNYMSTKTQVEIRGISAYCQTVIGVLKDTEISLSDFDLVILHNVKYEGRKRLKPLLSDKCTVISFIDAGQELTRDKDVEFDTLDSLLGFNIFVYQTETIIDIRDVLFATIHEKRFIDNQIFKIKLMKRDEALEDARANDEKNRQKISELEGVIAFHEQILNCLGIPIDEIRDYMNTLRERKRLISEANLDDDEAEELIAELQDEQAAILADIRSRFANGMAIATCENDLKLIIEEKLWNRLDESAKSYLITSKYTFESMLKADGDLLMDYSGVCLLITKAVEVEASRRFFVGYKNYLYKSFGYQYSSWPSKMLYTDNRRGTTKPNTVFTLGSVREIIMAGEGRISPTFMQYASKCLFSNMPFKEIEAELCRDVEFIERLRQDYRNPAAHTGTFDKIGATQCFEYVIEVKKMLQKMINKMDY